jgi:hypothetical protein
VHGDKTSVPAIQEPIKTNLLYWNDDLNY